MTIQEMHYYFKQGLDKADSRGNRNLLPPVIDEFLNAGQYLFIKRLAQPKKQKFLYGFEIDQRAIDSLRTLVIEDYILTAFNHVDDRHYFSLPADYMFHIKSDAVCIDKCDNSVRCPIKVRQHGDVIRGSIFDSSSISWRIVNGVFNSQGVMLIADFVVDNIYMTYLRQPARMSIAGDIGGYQLPDGTLLTTNQDCELPDVVHDEVVNMAVLIAKGDLEMPTLQYASLRQQIEEN